MTSTNSSSSSSSSSCESAIADLLAKINAQLAHCSQPTEPLARDWLQLEEVGVGQQQQQQQAKLRILHWNILAQALSSGNTLVQQYFSRVQSDLVQWQRRSLCLVRELLLHRADVICLNEVDRFQFLAHCLQPIGYEGIFIPKPRSPCLAFENNSGPDGTAIFYNKHCFELVKQQSCHLMESDDEDLFKNQSRGSQVALLLQLRHKASAKLVCIAATHLKAKVEHSRLRLLQTRALLSLLSESACCFEEEREDGQQKKQQPLPLILCGDFNGEHFEPFYKAISEAQNNNDTLLQLKSAYATCMGSEPAYTTFKFTGNAASGEVRQVRAIDYIWFRLCRLASVLAIPPIERLEPNGLPNAALPSDHLPLAAEFIL